MMIVLLSVLLAAGSPAVPSDMLGTWSTGSCTDSSKLLVITATTAKMGTEPAAAIVYVPDDAGPGNGAIHWKEEGSVDNFVYVPEVKKLVHNTQGYGMPGKVAYVHCPST
jgi:hypothetical protein